MPKSFVTINLKVTFEADDHYLVRQRLHAALERLEPARITTWFPDPIRCLQCNQPESEELRITKGICDACYSENQGDPGPIETEVVG